MSAPTITASWQLDLTAAQLRAQGFRPLILGDDYAARFQILDEDGEPEDLTGALLVLTLEKDGVTVERRSDTAIAGESPARNQLVIDDDQSAETGDAGKGWVTVHFGSTAGEVLALTPLVGVADYSLTRELADDVKTAAAGRWEILRVPGRRPVA